MVLIVLLILVISMIMLCYCYCKGKTRQKEIERQKDTAKRLENEKAEIERQKDTALKNLEIEKAKTGVKILEELRKIGGPKLFKMEPEKLKQYLNAISDFIGRIAVDVEQPASIPCEANQPNRVVSDGDETSEKDRETKRQIVANFLKDVHTQVQTHTVSKLHTMS